MRITACLADKKKKRQTKPSKQSPELIEAMLSAIRDGASREDAAASVGIGETTLYRWRKESAELDAAIKRADSECVVLCMKTIRKAAIEGQWTAAAWLAERKRPDLYGRRALEGATGSPEAPIHIHHGGAVRVDSGITREAQDRATRMVEALFSEN